MATNWRQVLHWVGSGLALVGVVFIAIRLHSYWIQIDLSAVQPISWVITLTLALVYGTANLLLAFAWVQLLRHFDAPVALLRSIKIYGISQLAKYIPGNIVHLAGRQALGMAAGIPSVALAKSTAWELGLIAVGGTMFGWLILPLVLPGLFAGLSPFLFLGSVIVFSWVLRSLVGPSPARAFILQVIFLTLSGATFVALFTLFVKPLELTGQGALGIAGAYVFAWLVGFVTPGAPAGVGVREAVLLVLLRDFTNEADLLLVVLVGRLVTTSGDLVFFLTAAAIPSNGLPAGKDSA